MKTFDDNCSIGGIALKNRLIRSATFEYAASSDGGFSCEHLRIYENLARGGIGAIITGMVSVSPSSRYSPTMVRTFSETFEASLRNLVSIQKTYGCPIIVQLCHCGLKTVETGLDCQLLGASDTILKRGISVRALSVDEIGEIIQDFATAAVTCRNAGISAVQIHAAHGFLLSQFLSPYYNQRKDEYGGNLENRSRFLLEVYDAVRNAVGENYPIWMKINCEDCTEPGMTINESLDVCKKISAKGIDAIEYSVGLIAGKKSLCSWPVKDKLETGYLAKAAIMLQERIDVPVISVGGYRSVEGINKALEMGINHISMSRPLIAEPQLVRRWKSGDINPARCISCNKCFAPQHPPLSCKIFGSFHSV